MHGDRDPPGRDQAMFEVCVGTELELGAGRLVLTRVAEAVGKLFAVVGEDLNDGEYKSLADRAGLCSMYTQRVTRPLAAYRSLRRSWSGI